MKMANYSLANPNSEQRIFEAFFENREAWLSRRHFISLSAALGGSLVLPSCESVQSKSVYTGGLDKSRKIVVLGAGAAGLTAAYRLMQKGIFSSIYEGEQSRIGGRIWTQQNFNADGQFIERGAELVDTLNENLIPLAQELGLEIELYAPGDKGLVGELFFYGGKIYKEADLYRGLKPFLKSVAKDISSAFPKEVESVTYKTIPEDKTKRTSEHEAILKFDRMSLEEYFSSKRGFTDSWIIDLLSESYMTEYGDDLHNQSALNFLSIADTDLSDGFTWYGSSDESRRVKGGNGQITDRLGKKLQNQVEINRGHILRAIRESGKGVVLVFDKAGGGTVEVTADQVICTLPFSTLRLVDGIQNLDISPVKKKSIAELGYGMNVKHMAGFTNKAWRSGMGGVSPSTGMLTTDLGVGMVWETSRLQAGQSGILTNFLGGIDGVKAQAGSNLKRMLGDLNKLWKGIEALHDGNSAMQHWPSAPFARGSYSSPKVGQYTSFFGCEGETELNGKLIFAGEHTSPDWWGYMNGAIQSGERAAKEVLGEKVTMRPMRRGWRKLPV
jgi:monoamine oxidase